MSTGFSTDAIIVVAFLAFVSAVLLVLVGILSRWLWKIGDYETRRRHDARVTRRRSREENANGGRQGDEERFDSAETLVPVAGDVTAFGGSGAAAALTSVCVGSDVPLPVLRHAVSVPLPRHVMTGIDPPGTVLESAGTAPSSVPVPGLRHATLLNDVPVSVAQPQKVPQSEVIVSRSNVGGGGPLMSPSPALFATTFTSHPAPAVRTEQPLPPHVASERSGDSSRQPMAPSPQDSPTLRRPAEVTTPSAPRSNAPAPLPQLPREGEHKHETVSSAEMDRERYSPVEGGSPEENPRSPPLALRILSPVLSPSAPAFQVKTGAPVVAPALQEQPGMQQKASSEGQLSPSSAAVGTPTNRPTAPYRSGDSSALPSRPAGGDVAQAHLPQRDVSVAEVAAPVVLPNQPTTATGPAEEVQDDDGAAGHDGQQQAQQQQQHKPRACKFCGLDLRDSTVLRADCAAAADALRAVMLSAGDGTAVSEVDASYSHQKISATIRRVKKEKKVIKELLTEGRVAEGQARLEILQRDFRAYI